jgi:hypothetical protein
VRPGIPAYPTFARTRYAANRRHYWDPEAALYTVHVTDDGKQCAQVLWRATGQQGYYDDALATAHAVDLQLSDERGVFVDIQGENDVVEPHRRTIRGRVPRRRRDIRP